MQTKDGFNIVELDKELFKGYLSEENDGIMISHIESINKGEGYFSNLLRQLMQRYRWIKVPTPSNQMRRILSKKGFVLKEEFFPEPFSCVGEVMFWCRDEQKSVKEVKF